MPLPAAADTIARTYIREPCAARFGPARPPPENDRQAGPGRLPSPPRRPHGSGCRQGESKWQKKPCKGINQDGSPCRGNGLDELDGYCIAHGPQDKTRAWRARGGKNASNAARADKRIPNRLRVAIEALEDGLLKVQSGELEPAAYSAMCRGAKAMADLYRLADQEMELIRREENRAAAAEAAGLHGDPEILAAASEFSAGQDQYRIQSLIAQRLVQLDPAASRAGTPVYVLTDAGRRRFGLQQGVGFAQADIDRVQQLLEKPLLFGEQGAFALNTLYQMKTDLEEAIAHLGKDPEPVLDPITGRPLTQPPPGVGIGTLYPQTPNDFDDPRSLKTLLDKQRQQVVRLARIFEVRLSAELSPLRTAPESAKRKNQEAEEETGEAGKK